MDCIYYDNQQLNMTMINQDTTMNYIIPVFM